MRDDDDFYDDLVRLRFELLSVAEQKALCEGISMLLATGFMELCDITDTPLEDTVLFDLLPPAFREKYDLDFFHCFFLTISSAAERIRNTEPPRSVAESIAMWGIFDEAIGLAQKPEYPATVAAGLRCFRDDLLWGTDFLELWDESVRGPDESFDGHNLEFSKWFEAFDNDRPVHPYVNVRHNLEKVQDTTSPLR